MSEQEESDKNRRSVRFSYFVKSWVLVVLAVSLIVATATHPLELLTLLWVCSFIGFLPAAILWKWLDSAIFPLNSATTPYARLRTSILAIVLFCGVIVASFVLLVRGGIGVM